MSAAVVPRQVDAQARGVVVGGLLLAPRPAMPGLDVAKFATPVVAGFLQRITFAPFQPRITELVGDLVQLILDVVHALLDADRKSTRLNSSHSCPSLIPSSALKQKPQ